MPGLIPESATVKGSQGVLRDALKARPHLLPLQLCQGVVGRVGTRRRHLSREIAPRLPVLPARLCTGNERLIADGRLLQPGGAGAAKIGDAGLRADTRAGQRNDALRVLHEFDGIL